MIANTIEEIQRLCAEIEDVYVDDILSDMSKWRSELGNSPDDLVRVSTIDTIEDIIWNNCTFMNM